jgi:hypothetical protein
MGALDRACKSNARINICMPLSMNLQFGLRVEIRFANATGNHLHTVFVIAVKFQMVFTESENTDEVNQLYFLHQYRKRVMDDFADNMTE